MHPKNGPVLDLFQIAVTDALAVEYEALVPIPRLRRLGAACRGTLTNALSAPFALLGFIFLLSLLVVASTSTARLAVLSRRLLNSR